MEPTKTPDVISRIQSLLDGLSNECYLNNGIEKILGEIENTSFDEIGERIKNVLLERLDFETITSKLHTDKKSESVMCIPFEVDCYQTLSSNYSKSHRNNDKQQFTKEVTSLLRNFLNKLVHDIDFILLSHLQNTVKTKSRPGKFSSDEFLLVREMWPDAQVLIVPRSMISDFVNHASQLMDPIVQHKLIEVGYVAHVGKTDVITDSAHILSSSLNDNVMMVIPDNFLYFSIEHRVCETLREFKNGKVTRGWVIMLSGIIKVYRDDFAFVEFSTKDN